MVLCGVSVHRRSTTGRRPCTADRVSFWPSFGTTGPPVDVYVLLLDALAVQIPAEAIV